MAPSLKVAARGLMPAFQVMEVLRAAGERVAGGRDVFHLEIGQPSTPAPAPVRAAAKAALDAGPMGYTDAFGVASLRRRLVRHYRDRHGVEPDFERIALTPGSSGGFLLAFLAAFDAGDRVAVARPGYPAYRHILRALGVEVVDLPTTPETRFQPTAAQVAAVPGPLHGLVIASPANPTGTMLGRAEIAALVETCAARGTRIVSDEIYHGISYAEPAASILEVTDQAIVINSFSKYFSMTGWRLGWMVLPGDLTRSVESLAQNLFICAPALSQHAAVAAFDAIEELEGHIRRYAANRAHLLEALPAAGFTRFAPADGAFYLYADVGHLTDDSVGFCRRLLAETGVAITPGVDFDEVDGHRFVRFAFAGSNDDVAEAARRLIAWRRGG